MFGVSTALDDGWIVASFGYARAGLEPAIPGQPQRRNRLDGAGAAAYLATINDLPAETRHHSNRALFCRVVDVGDGFGAGFY